MAPSISVVIPCYNEAEAIERTLIRVMETSTLGEYPRIFVVDAESGQNGTSKIVAHVGKRYPNAISYTCLERPSRGRQLICGAKMTSSPILVFLHADTLLPQGWDTAICRLMDEKKDVQPLLGCFRLSLPTPVTLSLRIMLWAANVRASVAHLPYGDQAYFVRREEYERMGGFADIPMMEDVDLLKRYKMSYSIISGRKQWRKSLLFKLEPTCVHILPMEVTTSPRRWVRKGVWWNTICNQFYMLAWTAGVSPTTIYEWYYGKSIKVA
ncbi:hypothetical protein CBS101457_005574 [Exobasidium rhododendri]|nr:hypothetical protein CBS101457_005574 [Exobasidium rhododendri]